MTYMEIGVNTPEHSKALKKATDIDKVILIEANPHCYQRLVKATSGKSNVSCYNVAIVDSNETESKLKVSSKYAQTGYIHYLPSSPHKNRHEKEPKKEIKVKACRFTEFTRFKPDVLYLDIEGAEWFVIKYLRHLPQVIQIEMYGSKSGYVNPYYKNIMIELIKLGYILTDIKHSDYVFNKGLK